MARVLQFSDLPVIEVETIPDLAVRRSKLESWAKGNVLRLSSAFVLLDGSPSDMDSYKYQIGYVNENNLVTSKQLIYEVVDEITPDFGKYPECLSDLKLFLELYIQKLGEVPVWGTDEYTSLVKTGKTPWILIGPNKEAGLRPNQRRYVVYNDQRELAYGPLLR